MVDTAAYTWTQGDMTALLERALREVARLPEEEQERIAAWLLEELASERRWEEAFKGSGATLELLADEALEERRVGKTEVLGTDGL